ncbi:unnamed protein product [Boreogadus saida]
MERESGRAVWVAVKVGRKGSSSGVSGGGGCTPVVNLGVKKGRQAVCGVRRSWRGQSVRWSEGQRELGAGTCRSLGTCSARVVQVVEEERGGVLAAEDGLWSLWPGEGSGPALYVSTVVPHRGVPVEGQDRRFLIHI